jgi:hypothetical protein
MDRNGWETLNNSAVNNANITAIGVSHMNNPNVVYYGTQDGQIYRLDNANTGDPNSVDIWTGKGLPNGFVNNIAVDKTNSNNAIAVFTNYNIISLFYTSDGGNNWTPIAGNLEENPDGSGNGPSVRWASIMNHNGQIYYLVATSTGVYSTTSLNGMNTQWSAEAVSVVGNIVCTMILTRDTDGFIAVGSHGNGLFTASTGITSVNDQTGTLPASFTLDQNYPNPFNPTTKIKFSVPDTGTKSAELLQLRVYDISGSEVATLVNENRSPGVYEVEFNAGGLTSGVYFYRLETGGFAETKKMILLK